MNSMTEDKPAKWKRTGMQMLVGALVGGGVMAAVLAAAGSDLLDAMGPTRVALGSVGLVNATPSPSWYGLTFRLIEELTVLTLTDQGRDLLERMHDQPESSDAAIFASLDADELASLATLLRRAVE